MAQAATGPGGKPLKTGGQTLSETELSTLRGQMDPTQLAVTVQTADGAITIVSGLKVLSKTSAAAMTLAAPVAGVDDGTQLIITAGTAFAHVVTATGLIHDGVTGGAKNTWTSAAFVGSSIHLVAYNALWHVVAKNLGTIA